MYMHVHDACKCSFYTSLEYTHWYARMLPLWKEKEHTQPNEEVYQWRGNACKVIRVRNPLGQLLKESILTVVTQSQWTQEKNLHLNPVLSWAFKNLSSAPSGKDKKLLTHSRTIALHGSAFLPRAVSLCLRNYCIPSVQTQAFKCRRYLTAGILISSTMERQEASKGPNPPWERMGSGQFWICMGSRTESNALWEFRTLIHPLPSLQTSQKQTCITVLHRRHDVSDSLALWFLFF